MARGYYNGSDWVSYQTGPLSKSTPTSIQEFKKQKTVKCPNCRKIVPEKDFCISCDYDLRKKSIKNDLKIPKKFCPICNKAQDIDNNICINCSYDFIKKRVIKLKKEISTSNTQQNSDNEINVNSNNKFKQKKAKIKKSVFNNDFHDDELYNTLKEYFNKDDYIKWNKESIPKPFKSKLKRFYNDSKDLSFSRLNISKDESIYYFAFKKDRVPKIMLIFNENPNKSNFRLYNDEVLVLLKINKNLKKINETFNLKKSKRDSKLYYLTLGSLDENIVEKIEFLITNYSESITNPFLEKYEFYETIDLNKYL